MGCISSIRFVNLLRQLVSSTCLTYCSAINNSKHLKIMSSRKFSLITAGCLSVGVALSGLSLLGDAKAIATTSNAPQAEAIDGTYLAQRGGGQGRRRGGQRWAEQLNLSDAQKTEIQAIRDRYRPQFQALRSRAQNADESQRQAIREEMKALRSEAREEMFAVLTPNQRQQAQQLMEERRAQRQQRRGGQQRQQ